MTPLRIVTLAGDPDKEASIAGEMTAQHDVDLVLRCFDRAELLAAIRAGDLDAIVSVGAPGWFDGEAGDEAATAGTNVVGLVENSLEAEHLRGIGATLLPYSSSTAEVLDACRASGSPPPPPPPLGQPSSPLGKVIAVWGPKGAPGRTTVAVELAFALSSSSLDTLVIDGDPYGGDVQQLLGVDEELATVVWAARLAAKHELHSGRLTSELRRAGADGPAIIPGIARPDLWKDVSESGWRQLLGVARATWRYTVVDAGFCLEPDPGAYGTLGEGRNRMTRRTLEEADQVVAVCRSDPLGLKQFLWVFEDLLSLTEPDKVLVVANKSEPADQREVSDLLRRYAGKRPLTYIPDRPNEVHKAVATGRPVCVTTPGSDVAASVRTIAAACGGAVKPRGLLSRLAGAS